MPGFWSDLWDFLHFWEGFVHSVVSPDDLLFYDRAAGIGRFHTTDGQGNMPLLAEYNWNRSWTLIIPL